MKCGHGQPLGKGNCPRPAAAPMGRMAPSRPTTAGPGSPVSEGSWGLTPSLRVSTRQVLRTRSSEVTCGGCTGTSGAVTWLGRTQGSRGPLCSKGQPVGVGSLTVPLGRAQRGLHRSPFPWGSAGPSCPQLLDGITPGWSPGAPRQVLQAARAQGSYQSSARSRWWTQGWPHVSSRGPRYRVQGPSLPSSGAV